jgi:putative ABC transport system permease protein
MGDRAHLYRWCLLIRFILKRQRQYLGLTLVALVGIILAIGLLTNASFFSYAVDRVILLQELADFSRITGRPPFSTSVYIFPSNRNPLKLEDSERLSEIIDNTFTSLVGLPLKHAGLQVSSGGLVLQHLTASNQEPEGSDILTGVKVIYTQDITEHIETVEGKPFDEAGASGEVLDVWMHERLAQKMGANPGETFRTGITLVSPQVNIRIAGIWHASDPQDEFWFSNPDIAFEDAFLVRRDDYIQYVQPLIAAGSREVNWYVILDDSKAVPERSASYLSGFRQANIQINKFLPGAKLNSPPLDPLESFVQRSKTLTIILLSYYIPAFGILLSFLVLTSAIVAQWQRKEYAILVSRGMRKSGVIYLTLLDQLLLFVLGIPMGVGFGMLIARAMGYTSSFLSFTGRAPLPVTLQGVNLLLILVALGLSMLARLWPVIRYSPTSVVSEEREWARPSLPPTWYRYYLDLLLILPTYYAYDQMIKEGSLARLIVNRPADIYQDPLLILVPALFIITASLLTMRLFSIIMRVADALAGLTPWLTLHLALRQLGRQSHDYVRPILLVIVTLAMGVYTVSMAKSLDKWLIDRMYYRTGADLTITPSPNVEGEVYADGSWIPAPADFLKVDGIAQATRVGDYPSRIYIGQFGEVGGRFLAIDRLEFPQVAWFRSDFAQEPLVGLMNRLAITSDGILVPEVLLTEGNLAVGDPIEVRISIDTTFEIRSDFTIAGSYRYFPTVYEEGGLTFIGNLDHLETIVGIVLPHDIWIKLKPGADRNEIREQITPKLSIVATRLNDTRSIITEEQAKMERVGIFGTLSIGFLAAAGMAVLGLLIYSYASLQERTYSFAVMNAVGLSPRQITRQVMIEFSFLALFGAAAGALIGIYASQLFIPFFRFTGETGIPLPPLIPILGVEEGRNLAIIFAAVVLITEILTISSTLRQQLAFIVKRSWF